MLKIIVIQIRGIPILRAMRDIIEDIVDIVIDSAEKSVYVFLSTMILGLIALFFLGIFKLLVLPPLVTALFFTARVIYKAFDKSMLGRGRVGLYLVYPQYLLLSLMGMGFFNEHLEALSLVFTSIVLFIVLVALFLSKKREYDVVL